MTLRETLDLVPDFRSSQGRRHSLGAILALATCAMLCGARSLYAIAQWGRDQGGATAQLLGFSQEKTPCVATLHRVFKGLDVAAFEAEVGNWLANSGVEADDPLSLDGKTLRGVHGQEIPGVHLVSAYASRAGAVLAQVAAPGKGEELAAVKEVLGQVPLKGRVVVADALLTQRKVCEQIVAGGDAVLGARPTRCSQFTHSPCCSGPLALVSKGPASSAALTASRWPTRKRETASRVASSRSSRLRRSSIILSLPTVYLPHA